MVSRILVKLIDQSIIPALMLLGTRIVSVILICNHLNIDYTIGGSGFSFGTVNDYIVVNSYSTFFMIVVLIVGLFYVLLKAHAFHATHITPSLTAKLFSMNLSTFIQSSFDLYSQGSVWLSYTYLLTLVAGLMAFFGLIYPWVFYLALVLSVIASILLIIDVENEIDIKKSSGPEFDTNDQYLESDEEEVIDE